MLSTVVLIPTSSDALPSGSLHRPFRTVHCLVLQRKEFKVAEEVATGMSSSELNETITFIRIF